MRNQDTINWPAAWAWFGLGIVLGVPHADAHWNVLAYNRLGAPPAYAGSGWAAECFLNIPEESAVNLFSAERFVAGRTPDFTFKTDWIDFPAGPTPLGLDTSFSTMGDFFDDYLRDVSDSQALKAPFSSFLVRFRGVINVVWEENADLIMLLPVWVDVACNGYDGFRVHIGDVGYRIATPDPSDAFYWEHFFFSVPGMHPIEITYFNRYEPDSSSSFGQAGFEVYTLHGNGLPWPAGERLVHSRLGAATIVPPRVIYQPDDVLPVEHGDFDTDHDFDLRDFHWLQSCFSGPADEETGNVTLGEGCNWMDFDADFDVDLDDAARFHSLLGGP